MASSSEREHFVYIAKLAEESERFEDVIDAMKKIVNLHVELTQEERNLLSFGYKGAIGLRRVSWRILTSIERNELAKDNEQNVKRVRDYRKKVECEISSICDDIVDVIDHHLIPYLSSSSAADSAESFVFYYKTKGDYYRYLAEFKNGDERIQDANRSLNAYQTASTKAEAELGPTNAIRLGLDLNLSVFFYEILDDRDSACKLAKKAFDDAISELDSLGEEAYKDSALIIQLLRDNLTLWSSDTVEDGVVAEDAQKPDNSAKPSCDKNTQ